MFVWVRTTKRKFFIQYKIADSDLYYGNRKKKQKKKLKKTINTFILLLQVDMVDMVDDGFLFDL